MRKNSICDSLHGKISCTSNPCAEPYVRNKELPAQNLTQQGHTTRNSLRRTLHNKGFPARKINLHRELCKPGNISGNTWKTSTIACLRRMNEWFRLSKLCSRKSPQHTYVLLVEVLLTLTP